MKTPQKVKAAKNPILTVGLILAAFMALFCIVVLGGYLISVLKGGGF